MATGGYRSNAARWLGRVGGYSKAGYRSLLGYWIGGASGAIPSNQKGGYRSPLAFWLGGASKGSQTTSTPPSGGQWYDIRYELGWVRDHNNEWKRRIVADEDWIEEFILAEDDF